MDNEKWTIVKIEPLTIILVLAAALLTWGQVQSRLARLVAVSQAGQEARIMELLHSLPLQAKAGKPDLRNPWNTAVETVLLSEAGRMSEALELLPHTPEGAFRRCWEATYSSGPTPSADDITATVDGLGGGLAAKLMQSTARTENMKQYRTKAIVFFSGMFVLFLGALAGIGIGTRMWLTRKTLDTAGLGGRQQDGCPQGMIMRPASPDNLKGETVKGKNIDKERDGLARQAGAGIAGRFSCVGSRDIHWENAIRVFLGWYVVFLLSGTISATLNSVLPLGAAYFPLTYAIHAAAGIAFICLATDATPAEIWRGLTTRNSAWFLQGIKFLLVALGAALILTLVISPLVPDGEPPQKELIDLIRTTEGIVPFILVFGTIAILGPIFEEIFFRGFLFSVLQQGLSTRWALALSSIIFGAFHLSARAVPVLVILGAVMALAFIRTKDIKTAIFVHCCWNGGVFLIQKILLG